MSFLIAIIMWIYSWESRPEVKPWPPEPLGGFPSSNLSGKSKYKAMMDEAVKQMKKK